MTPDSMGEYSIVYSQRFWGWNCGTPALRSFLEDERPSAPVLSIIIPAYNEESRLPHALARKFVTISLAIGLIPSKSKLLLSTMAPWMAQRPSQKNGLATLPSLRLISNGKNHGKGYSVRHGMQEARGRVALFTDADLSAPIEEADKLFAAIEAGNDVAIGSRAIDRSLIFGHQSRLRELAGMIFNGFVRLFTGLSFRDTQCGFKAFMRERSHIIFEQQRIEGFGFDPELLFF